MPLSNLEKAILAEYVRRKSVGPAVQSYSQYFKSALPPSWTIPAHVARILEALDAVERGEIDRLAISMPPRHGKSETITVRYPGYCLTKRPQDNVLVTSYNQRLAERFGRKTRNNLLGSGLLARDAMARMEFSTLEGGTYVARGVGSPPTGVGFSRIIIDDPIKNREQAESALYRENAWEWFASDIYSRLEPSGAIIMVCTRWHHDDVLARAVASEPGSWHVINLPAISDDGQALWPERYSAKDLERIRSVIGLAAFESLYQGNPTPREGAFFTPGKIGLVKTPPSVLRKVRYWDLAATAGDGDYTVGLLLGVTDSGTYVILDIVRGQWDAAERDQVMLRTAFADGSDVLQVVPQDPGAAGKESAERIVRLLAPLPVRVDRVSGSKELRAEAPQAQVNAGNAVCVLASWTDAFLEELRQFPSGAHDDQVDCLSGAFAALASKRVIAIDELF